jgi:hypothetical protein
MLRGSKRHHKLGFPKTGQKWVQPLPYIHLLLLIEPLEVHIAGESSIGILFAKDQLAQEDLCAILACPVSISFKR